MRFMLDTTVCIDIIRRRPQVVMHRLERTRVQDVCVSAVTLSELEYGVTKSNDPTRNRLALAEFITPLQVLPYDEQAAVHYGSIRVHLQAKGIVIGPLDMLIAAHARSLGLELVTSNIGEFRRIPALKVADWRL